MLEYIQVKLNTPEDYLMAIDLRKYPANYPTNGGIAYLCYEVSESTYLYSTTTSIHDLLLNTFEEFNQAVILVNTGVPIDKVLEVLHGKYPVYNLPS